MKQTLSLDRPFTYQIRVPGQLDESWLEWNREMRITFDNDPPVTTLTAAMDQASLQGLLRRLYSLGIPVISVECLEYK